jgi:hypothetical protein
MDIGNAAGADSKLPLNVAEHGNAAGADGKLPLDVIEHQ